MSKKNYSICVVGLGYVGLPLAAAFAEKFEVIGFDNSKERILQLKDGHDKTQEIDRYLLESIDSNMTFTSNIQDAEHCNIYVVTVPTPVDSRNVPDLSFLIDSSRAIGLVLGRGDIVIYESTVYPTATETVCVPELEKSSGLVFNQDFFCGYSPERINPGDKQHTVANIVKVTSGSTPDVAKKVDELYREIIVAGTYLAPSIQVAEASKVIENIQRDVNIALINELALIFDQMDIDTGEVIKASATKWNFIRLMPGLVGGHCIGVDPYYLTFKSEEMGYLPDLILTARRINNGIPQYIANKTIKEMIKAGKTVKGSSILILGATFKENCPDTRNTKVINIIKGLKNFDVDIDVYDPWAGGQDKLDCYENHVIENPLQADKKYDAIIVAVAHDEFKAYSSDDYEKLSSGKRVVIDIKNIVENPTWKL